MNRAIDLAKKGKFQVSPNPRVGAVIVNNNQIIGEGYHQEYGKSHAEVNAINSVEDKSLLKESILYVNLEPCSHHGKTPPCAELILKHQIPKVIIANKDPFKHVNGSGIEKLKNNGVEISVGIAKEEATELNKRFFTFHQQERPYIILKWAESSDGFIGINEKTPIDERWITGKLSSLLSHLWRAEEDGILIGKNTAKYDDPELNCRHVKGRNPVRILIDKNLEVNQNSKIYNDSSKTIILNAIKHESTNNTHWVKIDFEQFFQELFSICNDHNIMSLIIEGGAFTLNQFIESHFWDEARIFRGQKTFNSGVKAPQIHGHTLYTETIESDHLTFIKNIT